MSDFRQTVSGIPGSWQVTVAGHGQQDVDVTPDEAEKADRSAPFTLIPHNKVLAAVTIALVGALGFATVSTSQRHVTARRTRFRGRPRLYVPTGAAPAQPDAKAFHRLAKYLGPAGCSNQDPSGVQQRRKGNSLRAGSVPVLE
ncbi:hypothetical protein [Streptomyces sp. NBC_01451]|uniref:hypothetical protein n=1 Tax=Streptomyces sp. NBC_01451 TaxID=2903872 RepID=UPI002E31E0AE|nr:hypothetical protein [Streptomyces sp. NBC_01451]